MNIKHLAVLCLLSISACGKPATKADIIVDVDAKSMAIAIESEKAEYNGN